MRQLCFVSGNCDKVFGHQTVGLVQFSDTTCHKIATIDKNNGNLYYYEYI